MSIFTKTVLALALSAAAVLPAAADSTPDSVRYSKENMERYMPHAQPRGAFGGVFLQQRQAAPVRQQAPRRQGSEPGFGG